MPSDSHRVAILCEFGSVNGGEHSLLALVPVSYTHLTLPTILLV